MSKKIQITVPTIKSETVFQTMETAIVGTITNPVSATVSASVKVLTNPFRQNRKGFREYYGSTRRYSNKVEKIDKAVKACNDCDAKHYGVQTVWHKAGDVRIHYYNSFDRQDHLYTKDTFCPVHKSDALKAQDIVRMALGY